MTSNRVALKVVLLGEGRVGKSSLSARFVSNAFDKHQPASTAAAFASRQLMLEDSGSPATSRTVDLNIWDTAGQERFASLAPVYYRNADAALLVFDVTDAESFRRVRNWVRELRQIVGHEVPLTIAANKQDLPSHVVPDKTSRGFASTVGAAFYRTSAKTGAGIEQAFIGTAREALKCHLAKKAATRSSIGGRMDQQQPLTWGSPQRRGQQQSSCC